MITIPLTQGQVAFVDEIDLPVVEKYRWYACRNRKTFYAFSTTKIDGRINTMHRLICEFPDGKEIDHANGNGLDNRRINLRICNRSQNEFNKEKRVGGTSIYKGVYWRKDRSKWAVEVRKMGSRVKVGVFIDEIEAAFAYDRVAKEMHGEFARLNFPHRNTSEIILSPSYAGWALPRKSAVAECYTVSACAEFPSRSAVND